MLESRFQGFGSVPEDKTFSPTCAECTENFGEEIIAGKKKKELGGEIKG